MTRPNRANGSARRCTRTDLRAAAGRQGVGQAEAPKEGMEVGCATPLG